MLAGIKAVSAGSQAVLVLLGDQPLVSTEAIDRIASAYRQHGAVIVQAAYGGEPGNPVLFDRSLYGELATVTGDEGARSVVRRHRDAVTLVEVGDVADITDVDTEADYARLLELWEKRR